MKRAAMLAIFSVGIGCLLSDSLSLVCPHFVEKSRGAHRDSAAADSFFSLGLLPLGTGRAWLTPLHRQQHHRCGRRHRHHHRHRFCGGLRFGPLSAPMDKCLSAPIACHLDVSADRHCRPGVEPAQSSRLAQHLSRAGGGLHRAFVAPGDLDSHDFFS